MTNDSESMSRMRQEHSAVFDGVEVRSRWEGEKSPRQRVAVLVDDGSFFEIGALGRSQIAALREDTPSDGVVTGFGRVHGREVAIIADDALVLSRSDGEVARNKKLRMYAQALQGGIPLVYLADGQAASTVLAVPGEGRLIGGYSHALSISSELDWESRAAPFIVGLLGPCFGSDASVVGKADIIVASDHGKLGVASGGSVPISDAAFVTESQVVGAIRQFLGHHRYSSVTASMQPETIVSDDDSGDDLERLADAIVDAQSFLGVAEKQQVAGFATIAGERIALAGASEKSMGAPFLARLARVANVSRRFRIPLVLVQGGAAYADELDVDPTAFEKLTLATARVHQSEALLVSIVTRAGFAFGDFALGGRELGTKYLLAWATADVVPTPSEFTQRRLDAAVGTGPWLAAGIGVVDDVIAPSETRQWLERIVPLLCRGRDLPSSGSDRQNRILV